MLETYKCLQNDLKLSPHVEWNMFFDKTLQYIIQVHASSKTGERRGLKWRDVGV